LQGMVPRGANVGTVVREAFWRLWKRA